MDHRARTHAASCCHPYSPSLVGDGLSEDPCRAPADTALVRQRQRALRGPERRSPSDVLLPCRLDRAGSDQLIDRIEERFDQRGSGACPYRRRSELQVSRNIARMLSEPPVRHPRRPLREVGLEWTVRLHCSWWRSRMALPQTGSSFGDRSPPSAYDDGHPSSPVWLGARLRRPSLGFYEDPSLGSIGEMAWASERPRRPAATEPDARPSNWRTLPMAGSSGSTPACRCAESAGEMDGLQAF